MSRLGDTRGKPCFKKIVGVTAMADTAFAIVATVIIYKVTSANTLASYADMERLGAAMGLSVTSFLGSFLAAAVLSVVFWTCAWHTKLVRAKIFAKNIFIKKRSKLKVPWLKLALYTIGVDLILQIPMLVSTLIVKDHEFGQTVYGLMTVDFLWTIVSFPFDMLIVYFVYRTQHKIREHLKQQKTKTTVQS